MFNNVGPLCAWPSPFFFCYFRLSILLLSFFLPHPLLPALNKTVSSYFVLQHYLIALQWKCLCPARVKIGVARRKAKDEEAKVIADIPKAGGKSRPF